MALPPVLVLLCIAFAVYDATACIYNDTACTCAMQSAETICLRPLETNTSLCESYPCSSGFACDCTGSYICSIAECSVSQRSYLPTTVLSSSNITSCVISEVSICTTLMEEIDDTSDDSDISYNYTIVASGDFTVYSGGESLYSVAVRAPRRGGREESTGCDALIIELMYTYDPEMEQGLSFAIQDTDSGAVYVSGDPSLTVRMAFNPAGDYRNTDLFDFSSWVSPAMRANLQRVGSFGEADDEFGAQPLGFDSANDTSVNNESGTYVYYIELPFCENPKSLASRPGKHDKGVPFSEEHEKPMNGSSGELSGNYATMSNGNEKKTPGIPPGFENVTVLTKNGDLLSDEQLADLDLDLEGLLTKKMKYSIVGSGDLVIYVLGKQARNASMMTVIQGYVDVPCVPILIEMSFMSGKNNLMPGISVVLEMESGNGKETHVSGSNLRIAVVNMPPPGYLNPKAIFNFSVFAPAVMLPKLEDKTGFSLLHKLDGAKPVGYNTTYWSNTSSMYPEEHSMFTNMSDGEAPSTETSVGDMSMREAQNKGIVSRQEMGQILMRNTSIGNMTMGDTPLSSNGTFAFVIFPPCGDLFAFDSEGHAHGIPIDELDKFDQGTDLNKKYGEDGKPAGDRNETAMTGNEPKMDFFGDVGFAYSEGEIDPANMISDGYLLAQLPTTEITFLMTASDSYNVTILGQKVENGSMRNILFGSVELPCTPVVIETIFAPNRSAVHLPGLSLAIVGEGPDSVVNVTTPSKNLPVLVAVNPRPGYDKLADDYDFADFKQAFPLPSISNSSGFRVMKDLVGAIPIGPIQNSSAAMSANFTTYYNTTGMEMEMEMEMNMTMTMKPLKVVYIVRLPTCPKLYKFGVGKSPVEDEILDEMFRENGGMPAETEKSTNNTYSSHGEEGKIGDHLRDDIEAIIDNYMKYADVIVDDRNVLDESLHGELGQQLMEIPSRKVHIAIAGSNEFRILVLGKQVVEVSKGVIFPGSVNLPCTRILVEMDFLNGSDIRTPYLSVVLSTMDDSKVYASGKDLDITVAFNPPENYFNPNSEFLASDLIPAAPLLNKTGKNAFGLLYDMFDAAAVGYTKSMSDESRLPVYFYPRIPFSDKHDDIDRVEEDTKNDNNGAFVTLSVSTNETNDSMRDENDAAGNETMWIAPNGKYIFIINPPCPILYSFDKDGKPFKEMVSSYSLNSSLEDGGMKPDGGLEDEMVTEEFFHSSVGNFTESVPFADSEFDVDKIEEDLTALGFNIDDLPVTQFLLEMTSSENFEVFAVGRSIESGYKGQVLRGEAFLPCTPILVVSKFMPNESVIMPAISVAITHETSDSAVTFVSGKGMSNESLNIWVGMTADWDLDGASSGYNFSSLEHAIEAPSLRNMSSFRYLENEHEAMPVGSRLIPDLSKYDSNAGDMNEDAPVEISESNAGSENWMIFVVFVIQPPMCESIYEFNEEGMTVVDDLLQNDEIDLSKEGLDKGKGSNGTSEESGSAGYGMDAALGSDDDDVSGNSIGVTNNTEIRGSEDSAREDVKETSDGGLEDIDIQLKKMSWTWVA